MVFSLSRGFYVSCIDFLDEPRSISLKKDNVNENKTEKRTHLISKNSNVVAPDKDCRATSVTGTLGSLERSP